MSGNETRQKIMAEARLTVQDRGYAGLSFRELAKDVGIKSASIHHYFPTKGVLGAALAERYTEDFEAYLDGLLADGLDVPMAIARYIDVFRGTLKNENRMCLAGILSAEHKELPEEVRAEVVKFAEMNVRWLVKVLSRDEQISANQNVTRRALAVFAAIEGAQLIARSRNDVTVFDEIVAGYEDAALLP